MDQDARLQRLEATCKRLKVALAAVFALLAGAIVAVVVLLRPSDELTVERIVVGSGEHQTRIDGRGVFVESERETASLSSFALSMRRQYESGSVFKSSYKAMRLDLTSADRDERSVVLDVNAPSLQLVAGKRSASVRAAGVDYAGELPAIDLASDTGKRTLGVTGP